MAETAQTVTQLRDFGGLTDQVDELDLRPGSAVIQTNFNCDSPGKMVSRDGLRELSFEE